MSDTITIEVNSRLKSILKTGLLIRACLVFIAVVSFALSGLSFFSESPLGSLICLAISLVLFLVFFKILNAVFYKERVVVTKQELTVIHKNLSNTKEHVFELNKIKYFGFASQQYTKHALDNPVVDFTGLATQERELQYVIDEGNIKIETETKNIKFGKNMPSWEVEELVEQVELFTGRKFASPQQAPVMDSIVTEPDPDLEMEDVEMDGEQQENETPSIPVERYSYQCDEGELIIEQKLEIPSSEDIAYLNGRLAPTGKYKIGEKQFVLVSNGLIYAVRGFGNG